VFASAAPLECVAVVVPAKPRRTVAGYRIYADEVLDRLRFIQDAKALGFSLKEIRDLRNICIVVCEQVLSFVLDVADRLLVMENGRIVHTDTRKNVDEAAVARFLAV